MLPIFYPENTHSKYCKAVALFISNTPYMTFNNGSSFEITFRIF